MSGRFIVPSFPQQCFSRLPWRQLPRRLPERFGFVSKTFFGRVNLFKSPPPLFHRSAAKTSLIQSGMHNIPELAWFLPICLEFICQSPEMFGQLGE